MATSACGFATLGIFGTSLERQGFDLSSALAWRFSGAALLFWVWLLTRGTWRIPAPQAGIAFIMGAIGYALQSTGYFVTFERIGVGLTSLLLYTYPAFVTLLAWLVDHVRPSRRRLTALVIAFAGTSLAADPRGGHADLLGVAIGLGTAAWYAIYLTVSMRVVRSVDSLSASGYVCLGAMLSFVIAALARGGLHVPDMSRSLLPIAGIVVIATVMPIVTLFAGMRRLGAPRAALISTLEPVVTIALAAAILHERFVPIELLGGALIVTALLLLQFPERLKNR